MWGMLNKIIYIDWSCSSLRIKIRERHHIDLNSTPFGRREFSGFLTTAFYFIYLSSRSA